MIQLTKDLLLTNSNLNKTPKEAKKHDSNSSGKDFASILEMEDDVSVGTKVELAEGACVEEENSSAENSESGKKVLNKGDDFLSISLNLQLLINEPGNQSIEIDAGEVEENVSDEIVVSDESGKTEPVVNVDLFTLNVNLENVNLENITLESRSLENINVENISLENIKDNPVPVSDVQVHNADDEVPPEKGVKFDVPVPQVNTEQPLLQPEDESDVNLLPGDGKVEHNIDKTDVNKSNTGINQEVSNIIPEIIETPGNKNDGLSVVEPEAENVDFASKMAETGEVLVNQNLKTTSKTEAKPNKKSEAVNKPDSATAVPEEKNSVLTVDKGVDDVQSKIAAQTGGPEKAASVDAETDIEKSNVVIKSSVEDKIPESDAEKPEWGNKRPIIGEQIRDFDKEAGTAAGDLDIDNDITAPRPEFQDFMDKISEQRSVSGNGAAKAQPQQMNLLNRGPAAFSESVANVVRFTTNSGGLTKATLIVDPPALGRVNIEITSADNGIETVLKVSNEQVKILVQDQIIQLKQNLAQIGVNLAEFSVDVQQDDGRQRGQSFGNKSRNARAGIAEEEESEAEKIETFRVDLRKGLLHWVA